MIRALAITGLLIGLFTWMVYRQVQLRDKLENCPSPILAGDIPADSAAVRAGRISCTFHDKCLVRIEVVTDLATGKVNYETECN